MMSERYELENDVIVINKELTDLDLFVMEFTEILKKYSKYLIVSDFVSISTGMDSETENVDILVPIIPKEIFSKLFEQLENRSFWCYQGDSVEKIYQQTQNKQNIRFAKKDKTIPNIALITIDETRKAQFFELNNPQKIRVSGFEFNIPPIEFEILFKEILLGRTKDLANAKYLREMFKDFIKEENFKKYEEMINNESR